MKIAVRGALVALVLVGIGYRLYLATRPPIVRADASIRYIPLAQNLLAGRGFSSELQPPYTPTAHEVPGYPLFLAALLAVSNGSLKFAVWVQLMLELVTVALTVAACRLLTESQIAGWVAGALVMGCLFLPSSASSFNPMSLNVLLSTLLLLQFVRLMKPGRQTALPGWVVAGAVAGVGALVRVDTYLFVFTAGVYWGCTLVWRRAPLGVAAKQAIAFCATFFAVLSPWIVRDKLVSGELRLPGQGQFSYSHVGAGFKAWMDTWADDGGYLEAYVWGPFDRRPARFPAELVPDRAERERAEKLFAEAKAAAVDPFPPHVDQGFLALASEVRQRRPIRSTLVVGVRRALTTWLHVPGLTVLPGSAPRLVKLTLYGYVLLLFGLAAAGVLAYRSVPSVFGLPAALIAARSAIPFASAWGLASYYLDPAVPAVVILAAAGLSAGLEPKALAS